MLLTETMIEKELSTLLRPANLEFLACIDERRSDFNDYPVNPVNLPGATEGVIDAIKAVLSCSEEEAWRLVDQASLPVSGHTDDHHGINGCGYRKLVETAPQAVGAPEAVSAQTRYERILHHPRGKIVKYYGEHQAKYAVLNYRPRMSISQNEMPQRGIFSNDVWAAREYARRLNIDQDEMVSHIEAAFKGAVTALTGGKINQFQILK